MKSRFRCTFTLFLFVILVSYIIPLQNITAIGFSFDNATALSAASNDSIEPQITASGSDVYVVWRDKSTGTGDIFFTNSTDDGATFDTAINLSGTGGVTSSDPQLALSGNNVYVAWKENTNVFFKKSSDNGVSFLGSPINISPTVSPPQLDANGNAVYLSFQNGANVYLSSSTNTGSTFKTTNLSNSLVNSQTPQIASSGTNVYVVWREDNDISFAASANNGDTFGGAIPLISSGSSPLSKTPDIAATGTNVYAVWKEGTDIFFTNSTDSGNNFSVPVDIGNTGGAVAPDPQVVVAGSNVYVVWQDDTFGNGDILLARSTDGGITFSGSPQNISDNSGLSQKPKLAASGTSVYVTWQDDTTGHNDIFFSGSDNSGANFSGAQNISRNNDTSEFPQIALSGTNALVIWDDAFPGSKEVFFTKGTVSSISVSLDQSQYKLSQTASITIDDSSKIGQSTISAHIDSSTGDSAGFNLSLSENPINSGTFTGSLTFSESLVSSSSESRLKANPGDTITVSYESIDATATVFTRTVEFDSTSYGKDDSAGITVTDNNSNLNSGVLDTVTVTITSGADAVGNVKITLTETGVDTGVFGGAWNANTATKPDLIFYRTLGIIPINSITTVNETDTRPAGTGGFNTDATTIQTITETIKSTSDSSGVIIDLTENSVDSGVFLGTFRLSSTTDNSIGTLKAVGGDILTIQGQDALSTVLALVTPASPSQNAIKVLNTDTVTATLGLSIDTASVIDTLDGFGGGGGGLVSPGLVVNALAGLGGLGGGADHSAPTLQLDNLILYSQIDVPQEIEQMILNHDSQKPIEPMEKDHFPNFDYPLMIGDNGFVIGGFENTLVTQTLTTKQPTTIQFVLYEGTKIQHFSLYTNLRDDKDSIAKSDTQILYNDGKDLKIIDPHGLFENVSVKINQEEDSPKKFVVFDITFANPMETSDIIIRAWDPKLRSIDTIIRDAIKVEPAEPKSNPLPQNPAPEIEELKSQAIPMWVKNNAGWWSEQQIDDQDFVAGIQYMINHEIITIQNAEPVNSSEAAIPHWIKNNAGWWASNQISDDDFVKAMEWLVTNGVITVK